MTPKHTTTKIPREGSLYSPERAKRVADALRENLRKRKNKNQSHKEGE